MIRPRFKLRFKPFCWPRFLFGPVYNSNQTNDLHKRTASKRDFDLSITSIFTDTIGRYEVLLPVVQKMKFVLKIEISARGI